MTLERIDASGFQELAPPRGGIALRWLGQAGFLVETGGKRIVVDPYLSDSLAEKYKGQKFQHTRMMSVPVAPENLTDIDWILCTHGHTDHMDHGTLPGLLAANPDARVLVPRAEIAKAQERGVPFDKLHPIDAGETLKLDGLQVTATPAAHETLAQDDEGRFLFLGYAFSCGGPTIWHSGDTIPFAGLSDLVACLGVDLALLPVNGRDRQRASNGVPGNLTAEEAIALTQSIGAKAAILHHFGMFDFNTVSPDEVRQSIMRAGVKADIQVADMAVEFHMSASEKKNMKVLAVCRGNICRSPTAEALLRKYLDRDRFGIDSAALMDWNIGRPPHAKSTAVAADHGIDISVQVARQVSEADFRDFDLILGMDQDNMSGLRARMPSDATARIAHFGAFLEPGKVTDIPDPYDCGEIAFQEVFTMLDKAARNLAHWAR